MDSGNLTWAIVATALVLFMTPGLALFYGGMVRAKSVVSMMMMSFGALGLVAVLWILYGYGMQDVSTGWVGVVGDPLTDLGLGKLATSPDGTGALTAAAYGATFAVITVALISGSIAGRARFGAWMLFVALFVTVDYFPVAGWVWNPHGWIATLGAHLGVDAAVIDYAGGTAVHINAGAAALALALVLGRRSGFGRDMHRPHNVPLVLLGAAILWFGWFGFNGGAAAQGAGVAAAGSPIGLIVVNTIGAGAAAILGWLCVERLTGRKPSAVGAASGAVAGLVAVTPGCANLMPGWAVLLGLLAGAVCAMAVGLKFVLRIDDSLDVVGVHLTGGLIGTLGVGLFATGTGLLTGGGIAQLTLQALAAGIVLVYGFGVAWLIGWTVDRLFGFRIGAAEEDAGADASVHGEDAYAFLDELAGPPVR